MCSNQKNLDLISRRGAYSFISGGPEVVWRVRFLSAYGPFKGGGPSRGVWRKTNWPFSRPAAENRTGHSRCDTVAGHSHDLLRVSPKLDLLARIATFRRNRNNFVLCFKKGCTSIATASQLSCDRLSVRFWNRHRFHPCFVSGFIVIILQGSNSLM